MKAIHKYKNAAKRGDKEALRRIAQSMGYKFTIHDMPKMIALLKRAGIELETVEPITKEYHADTKTLAL
jgi:hypothetical protein